MKYTNTIFQNRKSVDEAATVNYIQLVMMRAREHLTLEDKLKNIHQDLFAARYPFEKYPNEFVLQIPFSTN